MDMYGLNIHIYKICLVLDIYINIFNILLIDILNLDIQHQSW